MGERLGDLLGEVQGDLRGLGIGGCARELSWSVRTISCTLSFVCLATSSADRSLGVEGLAPPPTSLRTNGTGGESALTLRLRGGVGVKFDDAPPGIGKLEP